MDQLTDFPRILRYERERRAWSQEELAAKVGVGVKTVRRWEKGISLPHPYARQKLSKILGKSIEELELVNGDTMEISEQALDSSSEQVTAIPVSDTSAPTLAPASSNRYTQGELLCTFDAHASYVLAVDWEPDGERIVSTGGDGVVRVWDATSTQTMLTYRKHDQLFQKVNWLPTIYALAWSPVGELIASAGDGRKVYVWDAKSGETLTRYAGHNGLLSNVFAFAWSPDGKYIASACSMGGFDKTIHVWNARSGYTMLRYNASYGLMPHFSVSSIAWSPQGDRIACACGDKTVRIWDATSGKDITTFQASSSYIYTITWSPDGRSLALANSNGTAEIRNALDGSILSTCYGHQAEVRDIAWSPDGTYLATASNDTTVQLWNATNGERLYVYKGHGNWTTSVAWSPDGTRIASASNDKTVQVWQAISD